MLKIFKYLMFITLLLSIVAYLTTVFIPKDSFYYQGGRAPYFEIENSNDVAFIGSSHIEWGIDPNVIWDKFGIPSINYTVPGLDIKNSYYLLVELLKYQKPKVVVVDVFRIKNEDAVSLTNRISNIFNLSINKIDMINSNELLDNMEKRLDYYFPLYLYHSRKLEKNDLELEYKNIPRGHFPGFDKTETPYTYTDDDSLTVLDSASLYYINRIIALAKQENIGLFFVNTPNLKAKSEYKKVWKSIEQIAATNKIQFIDFNEKEVFDKSGLIYNLDIANDSEINGHLNHWGAHKVSVYLTNILKTKYSLVDRRNDSSYTFLSSNLKEYKAFLSSINLFSNMPSGQVLSTNMQLYTSDYIIAPVKDCKLILQTDGNLVLYNKIYQALWASNTVGKDAFKCIMQADGNLVLYDKSNKPLWASNTFGHPNSRLVLQDDGNLVIYDENNAPVWATNTSQLN